MTGRLHKPGTGAMLSSERETKTGNNAMQSSARHNATDNNPRSTDLAIEVRDLRVCLGPGAGREILRGLNLKIRRHATTCVIGASASGKSVAVRSILGILPGTPGIVGGRIRINPPGEAPVEILEGLEAAVHAQRNGGIKVDSGWQRRMARRLRPLWGNTLCYVAQLGAQALDPSRPVGHSLMEAIRRRDPNLREKGAVRHEALDWLERLNFRDPPPAEVMTLYPAQLSGGMAQRVVLAVALARGARFLFADEPTTGLDPESQDRLLELFETAKRSGAIDTLVLVTHDFGVAERLADHVAVISEGQVIEQAPASLIFGQPGPSHQTTRCLLKAFQDFAGCPKPGADGIASESNDTAGASRPAQPPGQIPRLEPPRLQVQGLRKSYTEIRFDFSARDSQEVSNLDQKYSGNFVTTVRTSKRPDSSIAEIGPPKLHPLDGPLRRLNRYLRAFRSGLHPRRNRVLDGIDLELYPGEVVGLVGPSGEGKTTLAACLVRLVQADAGRVLLDGQDFLGLSGRALRKRRRDIQLLFQDPTAALHPRMTVRQGLMETATRILELKKDRARVVIDDMLNSLHLEDCAESLPAQLSGGQLRRVGLCRALMLHPQVLIVDEPTASVDASLRTDVLRLLGALCTETQQTSILIISHDRRVIYHMADRAFTIKNGTLRSISRQSLRADSRRQVFGSGKTGFDNRKNSFQRECS